MTGSPKPSRRSSDTDVPGAFDRDSSPAWPGPFVRPWAVQRSGNSRRQVRPGTERRWLGPMLTATGFGINLERLLLRELPGGPTPRLSLRRGRLRMIGTKVLIGGITGGSIYGLQVVRLA